MWEGAGGMCGRRRRPPSIPAAGAGGAHHCAAAPRLQNSRFMGSGTRPAIIACRKETQTDLTHHVGNRGRASHGLAPTAPAGPSSGQGCLQIALLRRDAGLFHRSGQRAAHWQSEGDFHTADPGRKRKARAGSKSETLVGAEARRQPWAHGDPDETPGVPPARVPPAAGPQNAHRPKRQGPIAALRGCSRSCHRAGDADQARLRKEGTMPALHCATSRSTPRAMNIGEPTARRRRVRVRESWTQQAPGPRSSLRRVPTGGSYVGPVGRPAAEPKRWRRSTLFGNLRPHSGRDLQRWGARDPCAERAASATWGAGSVSTGWGAKKL